MMTQPLLLLALFAVLGGQAQAVCPHVYPMKTFSAHQMSGKWYVTDWASPFSDERDLSCVQTNIWQDNVWSYSFNITGAPGPYRANSFRNEGKMYLQEPYVPAKMIYTWRGRAYKYVVLDTDYRTHALVAACSESEDKKMFQYLAILSRWKELVPGTQQKMKDMLRRNGLNTGKMKLVDQKQCY